MAKTKRLPQQVIKVKNYGYDEINRLAAVDLVLGQMTTEERLRAFKWFKSKFSGEWPSDDYQ